MNYIVRSLSSKQILPVRSTARLWREPPLFPFWFRRISSNGTHLAVAYEDTIQLLRHPGICLSPSPKEHSGGASSTCFSPNGELFITASGKCLKLWNLDCQCVNSFTGKSSIWFARFNPDGKSVLTVNTDFSLSVWDLEGECFTTDEIHDTIIVSAAFSPDGNYILSYSPLDNVINIWTKEGEHIRSIRGRAYFQSPNLFSSDGKSFVYASRLGNRLESFDLESNSQTLLGWYPEPLRAVALSPDGESVLVATATGDLHLRRTDTDNTPISKLSGHTGSVFSVAFSPDGHTLASTGQDQCVKVWNTAGQCLQTLRSDSFGTLLTFSSDGKALAMSGGEIPVFKLWQLEVETVDVF